MVVKVALSIIASLVGGWMIFDGVHVLATGKYFGPAKPGPWSSLVAAIGLDKFSLGVPFILLGVLWILFLMMMLLHQSLAWYGALLTAILTLWFLPVGTVLSLLYLVMLFIFRPKLQSAQL